MGLHGVPTPVPPCPFPKPALLPTASTLSGPLRYRASFHLCVFARARQNEAMAPKQEDFLFSILGTLSFLSAQGAAPQRPARFALLVSFMQDRLI